MLRRFQQHIRVVRLLCVSLLILTAIPGCENIVIGFGGGDAGLKDLGIYRIHAFGPEFKKDQKGHEKIELGSSAGTAFLVNDRNLLVTNNHVIEIDGKPAPLILIVSVNKDKLELVPAEVVTRTGRGDPALPFDKDLALLRPQKPLPGKPLQIADYGPTVGKVVRAAGYPTAADAGMYARINKKLLPNSSEGSGTCDPCQLYNDEYKKVFKDELEEIFATQYKDYPDEFTESLTRGSVSKYLPNKDLPIVQHQAPIGPGNSGGPLLDACRSVVGINTYLVGNRERAEAIPMAIGSKFILDYVKAAGMEVRTAKPCLQFTETKTITFMIAATVILLSAVTLLIAFRRSPALQRGYTRLTGARSRETRDQGTRINRRERAAAESNTILPGGTVFRPAADPGAGVRLVPIGAGRTIILPAGRISSPSGCIIGREPGNDGVIDENTVSKRHARLTLDASGRLVIEDLGSSNGSWKKGAKITREAFVSGETVRFGSAEFKIEFPASLARQPAVAAAGGQIPGTVLMPGGGESAILLSGIDSNGRTVQFSLKPRSTEQA